MEDLSSLFGDIGNALIGGSSSSAGNTINDPITSVGPAPGSEPVNPVPGESPLSQTDTPAVQMPTKGANIRKPKYGNSPDNVPAIWKKVGE